MGSLGLTVQRYNFPCVPGKYGYLLAPAQIPAQISEFQAVKRARIPKATTLTIGIMVMVAQHD